MREKISVGLEEGAVMTGIGSASLRRMVRAGKIRSARVGRKYLIPVAELKKLIKAGGAPVPGLGTGK